MGKAAILIVVASLALGSIYAFGAKEDARQAEGRLSDHQYEILARNAALAGYSKAKQNLTDDFSGAPATVQGTYDGVPYKVTINRNGTDARIQSTGTAMQPDGTEADYMIDATIRLASTVTMADEAPPFMRYALMSEGDLSLDGSVLSDLYVDGDEANTLNANMHTNGSLIINGNSLTVKGFGTYVNTAMATPMSALEERFQPYYNPTGEPVTEQVLPIEVPTFDIPEFTNKVLVDETSAGDVSLSGTYDLGGTREDPYVWLVNGNLTATGGTNIKGYVMFIVDGNVMMSGNVDAAQNDYSGSDESNVAYYASGFVELAGNSKVFGQIFAGSGVTFQNGTPRVYGSISTGGLVTLSGTPKISYRVASPALTTIFEEGAIQHKLVNYAEL